MKLGRGTLATGIVRLSPELLIVFVGVALGPAGIRPAVAQSRSDGFRLVGDCRTPCRLRADTVAILGRDPGEGYVGGNPASLVQLHDGTYALADYRDPGRIKLYDSTGAYLRAIGRKGRGPGEFEMVQRIVVLAGDSIEVYDLGEARISTFTPAWDFVRATHLDASAPEIARLPDGSHVMAARWIGIGASGLPLHLVSAEGKNVRSFGAAPPIEDETDLEAFYRVVAPTPAGYVWSGQLTRYRLELWDRAGERLEALERKPDWFPECAPFRHPLREGPPCPAVMGLTVDADGLLWVLVAVPDPNWKEALGQGKDPYGRSALTVRDRSRYQDAIVEVIDPKTANVIGRIRLDAFVRGFVRPGLVYSVAEDEEGAPLIQVVSLQEGRGPSRPQSARGRW